MFVQQHVAIIVSLCLINSIVFYLNHFCLSVSFRPQAQQGPEALPELEVSEVIAWPRVAKDNTSQSISSCRALWVKTLGYTVTLLHGHVVTLESNTLHLLRQHVWTSLCRSWIFGCVTKFSSALLFCCTCTMLVLYKSLVCSVKPWIFFLGWGGGGGF